MALGGASAPAAHHLVTKVELTISCENLMDMDIFSKSDPLCALYISASGSHWYEVCIRPWWRIFTLTGSVILTGEIVNIVCILLQN